MNEPNDKAERPSGHGHHPTSDEVERARTGIADLVLGYVEGLLCNGDDALRKEHDVDTSGWCPSIQEQTGYEAACLVLGLMDGHAACSGVTRRSLDRSLRDGMRVGRTLALEAHEIDGCDGCDNSDRVRRLLEAN